MGDQSFATVNSCSVCPFPGTLFHLKVETEKRPVCKPDRADAQTQRA